MSNFLRAKRIEVFVIVVIVAVIGLVYALTQKAVAPATTSQNQDQASQVTTISYQGEDGRNALEILAVFHKVDTKDTSFGPQIIGIDGNVPDASNSYWAFYVNGKLAQVGADKYITKFGDLIEWKVEKF